MIEAGVGERLLDQRRDRVLDLGRRALGARLEALLQQRRKLVRVPGLRLALPAAGRVTVSLP